MGNCLQAHVLNMWTRVSQTFSSANFGTPKPTKGGPDKDVGEPFVLTGTVCCCTGFQLSFLVCTIISAIACFRPCQLKVLNVNEVDHIKKDIPNGYPLF